MDTKWVYQVAGVVSSSHRVINPMFMAYRLKNRERVMMALMS